MTIHSGPVNHPAPAGGLGGDARCGLRLGLAAGPENLPGIPAAKMRDQLIRKTRTESQGRILLLEDRMCSSHFPSMRPIHKGHSPLHQESVFR